VDDLISRTETIDALRTCYNTEAITYTNGNEYIDYDQALDLINTLPSAHPQRKNAYLINPNPYGKCSNCGQLIDIRDEYNYCPNCGADMREDTDDQSK